LWSESLNRHVSIQVTAAALRGVDRKGGLDAFLLSNSNKTGDNPGSAAEKLRKLVVKAQKKAQREAGAASGAAEKASRASAPKAAQALQ
jgi:ribosomal protein L28